MKDSFLISFLIDFSTFLTVNVFNFIAFGDASLRPPLSVIIKAHPALEASRAVLPKGSFFLGQTTEISDLINHFVTILFFENLKFSNFYV